MCDQEKTRRALFTWGSNSYGQLGLGGKDDTRIPQQVEDKWPILRSISAGGGHSAVIIDSLKVFVCGQNTSGQLGLGDCEDRTRLTPCTSLLDISVSKVSCGWDFSLILSGSGQLLSCGSNAYGQLGNGQQKTSSLPKLIQNVAERIVDIAAGLRHSLAVTESGQTLQWGSGLASHAKRFCKGRTFPAFYTAQEPCPVPGLENLKVKQVAAGSYHSVALSAAGELHVWGSNKYGQLLHPELFVLQSHKIERAMFSEEGIRAVWSGWSHLIAQSETGKVFAWGRSDYGQLGTGARSPEKSPLCVPVLTGASQVACGSEHNLALCGNTVYSWGWNEHGMCGNGCEDNVHTPTAICLPTSSRVELMACGAGHSLVVCTGQSTTYRFQ